MPEVQEGNMKQTVIIRNGNLFQWESDDRRTDTHTLGEKVVAIRLEKTSTVKSVMSLVVRTKLNT